MHVTLDTNTGVVSVHGTYSLDELLQCLSKLYPDMAWKKLETHTPLRLQMPPLPLPPDDDLPF